MINSFFRFSESPFSNTPDPNFFFPTAIQREALNCLFRGVKEKKGFLVLTGEIGTGKTTLCRMLLKMLGGSVDTALILNSDLSPEEILRAILQDFGLPVGKESKFDLMELLYRYLLERAASGRTTLIVIDDAQNLPSRSLEQVRMISNFETDKEKLVQILLVGQSELTERLNSRNFRQVRQRIAVRSHLKPLTAGETESYVMNRLRRAGGAAARGILHRQALTAIHRETGGYPRSINTLCDSLLTTAFKLQRKNIDAQLVRETALSLGIRQRRWVHLGEKYRNLKLPAAAALTLLIGVASLAYVRSTDSREGQPPQGPAGWEHQISNLEKSLTRVERRIAGEGMTHLASDLEARLALARQEAGKLRDELQGKEDELENLKEDYAVLIQDREVHDNSPALMHREKELEETIAAMKEERRRKNQEVDKIGKELELLKNRLLENEVERSQMAMDLAEKESLLAVAKNQPDKNEVAVEQLREKHKDMLEQHRSLQRMAARTIQNQNTQIERLKLQRTKLMKTLKKINPAVSNRLEKEESMLESPPQ